MTKQDWLRRCETVWKLGLVSVENMELMSDWLDFVLRLEHTLFSTGQAQGSYVLDFIERERERVGRYSNKTLASDSIGYALQRLAAVFAHPCQKCAEDPRAWHTRFAFCKHKAPVISVKEDSLGDKKT